MRKIPFLLIGGTMLALAGTPALAQDPLSSPPTPEELLPDPVPAARPLTPPLAAAETEKAVDSPAAQESARATPGPIKPCTQSNPCAVAAPPAPVKPS